MLASVIAPDSILAIVLQVIIILSCRFGVVGTASLRSWYRCSAYSVLQGVFFHS